MTDVELRILRKIDKVSGKEVGVLQFKRKDRHIDSPTTNPVDNGWGEWEDVPIENAS